MKGHDFQKEDRLYFWRHWHTNRCAVWGGGIAESAGGEVGELLKEGSMAGEQYASGTIKQNGTTTTRKPNRGHKFHFSHSPVITVLFTLPRLPLECPFRESVFFKLQVPETQTELTWAAKGSYSIVSKGGCSWLWDCHGTWNPRIRVIKAPFLFLSHGSPSFPSSRQAYPADDQEVVLPTAAWEFLLGPFPNLPPERKGAVFS